MVRAARWSPRSALTTGSAASPSDRAGISCARARRHLLEGAITARAGAVTAIRDDQLQRVAYARLVRKGLGEKRSAHSVSAGALTRTRMLHASVCSGAFADYTMAARRFTVSGRLGYCSGAPEVPFNPADGEPPPDVELAAEFRIGHAWDIASLSIGLDLLGGAVLLADTIQAPEQAIVGRYRLTGLLGSSVNVSRSLYGPLHVRVELGARTYMQRRTVLIFDPNAPTSDESLATTTLVTSVAVSLGAGLGVHF